MGELTIEIIKDIQGSPIDEHSLSLKASHSLNVFLGALNEVANISSSENDPIKVDTGTTKISIKAKSERLESIKKDLTDVAEGKSKNEKLISAWKKVQNTILANSLEYSVSIVSDKENKDFTSIFKNKSNFKKPAGKSTFVRFYIGVLKGVADFDKYSSIQLDINHELRHTIACKATDTAILTDYFKSDIYVSVFESLKGDKVSKRVLCDYYSQDLYEEIYNFYNECKRHRDFDKLMYIHKYLGDMVYNKDTSKNNLEKLEKFVKIFNHDDEDVETMRTVIDIINNIENENVIKLKQSLITKIENQIGEIF